MENTENKLFFRSHLLDSPSFAQDLDLLERASSQAFCAQEIDEYEFKNFCISFKERECLAEEMKVEDQGNLKKKRGRRKLYETEELRKARRAETNRMAARANRERKQMYIKRLEAQVDCLQAELVACKARLSKYEIIEQYRSLFGYEIHRSSRRAMQRCCEENKLSTDTVVYTKHVKNEMVAFIQECWKALEELAKSMVEISLPLHWRFLFWLTENNVDTLNLAKTFPCLLYTSPSPRD
eukprot:TRINITY_DN2536_c0_g1_i16.p1 TRINITY_DN2536_c0_g1~~TRINITY_DN2536_c0_g1_i16.p1  ORF type:complete len:239 (-),score=51.07 TRINITY_DN2536_c0_g1_i16:53-769(-)